MLREGREKLNSSSGASLAVALLFFVFMAVVGSSILAAASSSMGRIKNEDQGNQERYALYSAANLVVDAFSGKDAFSFQNVITQPGITYFIENDTGERYSTISPVTTFDPGASWTVQPSYEWDHKNATKIEEIRYQLSEKALSDHWTDITKNWSDGNEIYLSSLASSSDNENKAGNSEAEYPYQFELTGEDGWSKEAPAFKEVNVKLKIEDNFDIVGELSVHPQNDKKLADEVTGQKYYIRIPFSSEAMIRYGSSNTSYNPVSDDLYTRVDETGTIELDNFQWESKDQAVISTRKSEVE